MRIDCLHLFGVCNDSGKRSEPPDQVAKVFLFLPQTFAACLKMMSDPAKVMAMPSILWHQPIKNCVSPEEAANHLLRMFTGRAIFICHYFEHS